jgi:hypothetical protein
MSLRFALPLVLLAAASLAAVAARPVATRNEEIEKAMGQMKEALEVLGKGIKADGKDAALEQLAKFQAAVIAAKAQVPDSASKVDEKKRGEFVAEFRKSLAQGLELACQAEIAVLDGKFKDADGIARNKLNALKSAGHSKFNPQDGK